MTDQQKQRVIDWAESIGWEYVPESKVLKEYFVRTNIGISLDDILSFYNATIEVKEGIIKDMIFSINDKYDTMKRREGEITERNRCKFARENETLGESKARSRGSQSALLVVRGVLEKELEEMKVEL